MITANNVVKGAVLRDSALDLWDQWVVLEVNPNTVLLKRPYTNQGKSFIVFEEVSIPLTDITTTTRFTLRRI